MTRPRCEQIVPEVSRYYHCVARCVRRSFLCGDDRYSGQNFDHRKNWIVERLGDLTGAFTIRVCAYAVMSNHLHLVLYIDSEMARALSDDDVLDRYGIVFASSARAARSLPENERRILIETFRHRLADISWFMRCLSEHIARRANREDRCRGRFWEGRFRSQALLDDAAFLACMSYVDLNPVRAGLCETLEESEFTSIQQRLRQRGLGRPAESSVAPPTVALVPCEGDSAALSEPSGETNFVTRPCVDDVAQDPKDTFPGIPLSLNEYTELLVSTGREIRNGKPGMLGKRSENVLRRLGVVPEHWAATVTEFGKRFPIFAGAPASLEKLGGRFGLIRPRGRAWGARAFFTEQFAQSPS